MSLTYLSATTLTTSADLRRKPALDRGQLTRTFVLFLFAVVTLVLVERHMPQVADADPAVGAPRIIDAG